MIELKKRRLRDLNSCADLFYLQINYHLYRYLFSASQILRASARRVAKILTVGGQMRFFFLSITLSSSPKVRILHRIVFLSLFSLFMIN